ncbi:MAG: 1-acyl-sn-glycerol-3-phosphate acyltransferase [Planctomycetota bacterium]
MTSPAKTVPSESPPPAQLDRWPSRDTHDGPARDAPWVYRAIARWSTVVVRRYYRVEIRGEAFPASGPVLLVQNHSNGLVDAHYPLLATLRTIRILVKYKLMRTFFIGWMLRAMDAVPMYRQKDGVDTRKNATSFAEVDRALQGGSVITVFPEGESLDSIGLRPMKSGVARMAMSAEASSDEPLGLTIVPIGVTYSDRDRLRSLASAVIGAPIEVGPILESAGGNLRESIVQTMARVREALEGLILHADDEEEHRAAIALERILPRDDTPIGLRRRDALAALRADDPAEARRRREVVVALGERLAAADLSGDDVLGPTPGIGAALGPALWAGPLSLVALVVWGLPCTLGRVLARFRKTPDKVVTLRILITFAALLVWVPLIVAVAGWTWGWTGALVVAAACIASIATFAPMLDALSSAMRAARLRTLSSARDSHSDLRDAIRSIRQAFGSGRGETP